MEDKYVQRFWARVDKSGDCWLWTRDIDDHGYGRFWDGRANRFSFHVAYELLVGKKPPGLDLDHLCRNPLCVNPNHLEPVTHHENVLRGCGPSAIFAKATHCIHGHEFTLENTRIYYRSRGIERVCKQCSVEHNRAYRKLKSLSKQGII